MCPPTRESHRTLPAQSARQMGSSSQSTPNGIRTRVAAVKGRCPRPLDDGGRWPAGQRREPPTDRTKTSKPTWRRSGRRRRPGAPPAGDGHRLGPWKVQAKKHWTAPMTRMVTPEEVHLDEEGGEVGEVLRVAHGRLGHHDDEEHAPRPAHPLGDVGHVQPDDEPDGQADQEHDQARRGARPGHAARWGCAWPPLARGAAGEGAGARGRRAGGDHRGQERPARRSADAAGGGERGVGPSRAVVAGGAVDQHDGVGQQEP